MKRYGGKRGISGMKQSVVNQMKDYQRKRKIVKAVKYQKGMEDAWMAEYQEYRDDCDDSIRRMYDKLFESREDAKKCSKCIGVVPVVLKEVTEDVYDSSCFVIKQENKYYTYRELDDDSWIVIDDKGNIDIEYSTESFDAMYELPSSFGSSNIMAKIGYDKELLELFVDLNYKRIILDKSEITTVEKILEGLEIPYTEKLGEFLKWDE